MENGPFEDVFPINHGYGIFHCYVSLPEGNGYGTCEKKSHNFRQNLNTSRSYFDRVLKVSTSMEINFFDCNFSWGQIGRPGFFIIKIL